MSKRIDPQMEGDNKNGRKSSKPPVETAPATERGEVGRLSDPLNPRLPLAARQNAVLRMQQTRGNAAVVRMLTQRMLANHVQRDDDPSDDDATGKGILADLGSETVSGNQNVNEPNWSGIDVDNGISGALSSVPGSRVANVFWDVAGFTPMGGAASVKVDEAEATFRGAQAYYDHLTGDETTAQQRSEQAESDDESAAADAIGLIPGIGTGAGVMSLLYDLGTSDPRDSASNQLIDTTKQAGRQVFANQDWTAEDNARRMNGAGVKDLPGIPQGAVYQRIDKSSGTTKITCIVDGQQQSYIWDESKQVYVPAN